jgi:tetratricopeptide (TPR) repeat protein
MLSDEEQRIAKASELYRWSPYKVVSSIDREKEEVFHELPQYTGCRILELSSRSTVGDREDTPNKLRRFLKKVDRDGPFASLCMLAVFTVILERQDKVYWESLLRESKNDPLTDDNSLLVEGWPLVQEEISWTSFLSLYKVLRSRLCMVTLEHPLSDYAKRVLFQLNDSEFLKAVQVACEHKWIKKVTKNRLQASQFLLDYVASLPPRDFGVLLEEPTLDLKRSLPQSCLPLACLELSVQKDSNQLECKMISLYELQSNESFTVSTRQPPKKCSCFKCHYENGMESVQKKAQTNEWITMAQRLAHVYFQKGNYDQAKALYHKCHDYYIENKDKTKAADLWHSIAAVHLTELKFLQAQRHWKNGSHYQLLHSGVALQLEKQNSYDYFSQYPNRNDSRAKILPEYQSIGTSRRLFVCPNMVPSNICHQLITWAEKHASKGTGWTTSRHYAVPTYDIPVHQVPKLLNWFVDWFRNDAVPLLQTQFQTDHHFYVHDAFLVRYSACSSSQFLPIHYDESTHSLILALNSDFEGGGTYFYSQDKTIIPSCGSLVSFRGNQLLHGGNVVTKGERYILAIFLYMDKDHTDGVAKSESSQHSAKRLKTGESFSFGFF